MKKDIELLELDVVRKVGKFARSILNEFYVDTVQKVRVAALKQPLIA